MVVDQETGLLVPPKDAGALANALEVLVCDAGLREVLGAAGRSRAEKVFSLEAHGRRLQELYDHVLE